MQSAECRRADRVQVQALSGTGDSIIYFVTAADFFVSASLGSFFLLTAAAFTVRGAAEGR
jgi:hypothetical protein